MLHLGKYSYNRTGEYDTTKQCALDETNRAKNAFNIEKMKIA